jgi:hypothetical protein
MNPASNTRRALAIFGISILPVVGLSACGASTTQQPPNTVSAPVPETPLPATATVTRGTETATSWTMPNLVGSNLQSAQDQIQKLTDFAIAITTSHDATGAGRHQVFDRNWQVCSQNIAPGSKIDSSARIDFGAVKLEEPCP